tara:strand:+ start:3117 stop:3713 length:597 start_codon:yes stop_codon:yes gene_type:complete
MKNIEIKVPDSLFDIPLKLYQEFIHSFEDYENMTDEDSSLKMLEIFCGIKPKEGLKYKLKDVTRVVNKLNSILAEKPSLISKFSLGGIDFGFVPALNDLTFGEYIDAETNISDWSTMHKAMSVLYRPIDKQYKDKYTVEEYDGNHYSEILKNMPTSVAVSALVFFYALETDLLQATLNSTLKQHQITPKSLELTKTLE